MENVEAGVGGQRPLPKLATGVKGFDDILHGGIPEGRTTLLVGGAGSGKTVLSLETLYNAAQRGQAGVFISFEETTEAVYTNALSMGWDLQELVEGDRLAVLHPQLDYEAVRAGEFSIKGLLAVVAGHAERLGARLVVIDAIVPGFDAQGG